MHAPFAAGLDHLPVADADDLGCLPPGDPFRDCPQDHFCTFIARSTVGLRVSDHVKHVLLLSPSEKRALQVLSRPAIPMPTTNRPPTRLGGSSFVPVLRL